MSNKTIAKALQTIGEGVYMLADALLESPEPVSPGKPGAAVDSPPTAAPATTSDMPEFPPLPDEWGDGSGLTVSDTLSSTDQREYVLSRCPTHDKPWTVKEGGVSKAGKSYSAFWKCSGKDADGSFCNKKPDASWVKTHNPESVLVGA